MNYFDHSNTEIFTIFLGLQSSELNVMKLLVESYLAHYGRLGLRFNIVDQSIALSEELESLRDSKVHTYFKIHERYVKELPTPDIELTEIQSYLQLLEMKFRDIRVLRPERRDFHSQSINQIVFSYSDKRFILLLDSDVKFEKEGFFNFMSHKVPLSKWNETTAVGQFLHGNIAEPTPIRSSILRPVLNFVFSKRLNLTMAAKKNAFRSNEQGLDYIKWRFPRLSPHFLLLNRELIVKHGIRFKLMFLDMYELDTPQPTEYRLLGDCGASLLFLSACNGLQIGSVEASEWVTHYKSQSWNKEKSKSTNYFKWW